MLIELRLFKERNCEKETMAAGYYIDKRIAEKKAVERWENEGGRLSQNHDQILDSVGEDYPQLIIYANSIRAGE